MISIKYKNKNTFDDINFTHTGNLVNMTPTVPNAGSLTTRKLDRVPQLGDF